MLKPRSTTVLSLIRFLQINTCSKQGKECMELYYITSYVGKHRFACDEVSTCNTYLSVTLVTLCNRGHFLYAKPIWCTRSDQMDNYNLVLILSPNFIKGHLIFIVITHAITCTPYPRKICPLGSSSFLFLALDPKLVLNVWVSCPPSHHTSQKFNISYISLHTFLPTHTSNKSYLVPNICSLGFSLNPKPNPSLVLGLRPNIES